MRRSYSPHSRNTSAALIVLVSLLLMASATVSYYREFFDYAYRQKLKENWAVSNLPRIEKLTPMARRSKERIVLGEKPTKPISIPEGRKAILINRVPTDKPIVFITIDDGITKDSNALQFIRERELPISAFLTINDIKDNYGYFKELASVGTTIQNHTVTHHTLLKMKADQQKGEICSTSQYLDEQFGTKPTLFRPPYGEYNDDTLSMAKDCNIKAVVLWTVVVQGKAVHYQAPATRLNPGDIVLLHYKPELKDDLEALLKTIREQNMQIGQLEDWIK